MNIAFSRHCLWIFSSLIFMVNAQAQPIEGEIKKINPETSKITLKHGEIQSLALPAMQMAYRVSNPLWLQNFHVGDKVQFSVDKVENQFTVTSMEPLVH